MWRGIDGDGRIMKEEEKECDLGLHEDAADLGWGGAVSINSTARLLGEVKARDVWSCQERRV